MVQVCFACCDTQTSANNADARGCGARPAKAGGSQLCDTNQQHYSQQPSSCVALTNLKVNTTNRTINPVEKNNTHCKFSFRREDAGVIPVSLKSQADKQDSCDNSGEVNIPSTAQLLNWASEGRRKLEEGLEGKDTFDGF